MRAITLTQPWCGLMASGIKRVENRTQALIRRDAIGTTIAFHASREYDRALWQRIIEIDPTVALDHPGTMREGLGIAHTVASYTSAVTHVATLVDIVEMPRGAVDQETRARVFAEAVARGTVDADQLRWYLQRFGYVFRDERVLPVPVPCRGWQGCWTLPPDVAARVEAQLS